MKYAIVIPDGAADVPLEELGGKTPLEAAEIPNMDWLASHGRCGLVRTVPHGMPCGSDVAILSLFGYDPQRFYTGRAPLEAAAQGLTIAPDEWVFRCNFVTIVDGKMEDHSAGHITTEEGTALIRELNERISEEQVKFFPGVSYRHLMTFRGDLKVHTTPPHDILGQRADSHLPSGHGSRLLKHIIEESRKILADHEINIVRRDLNENPATSIWLWGEGKTPQLTDFAERFGKRGAVVTAVDLVRGLGKLIGWRVIDVPGVTGWIDTNFAGKGAAAAAALDEVDLVVVHVEATDEAGHQGNATAKVQALQDIDRHIVGPLLERLRREGNEWRMLVMPDHPTPCTLRTHTGDPVPCAIAGKGVVAATPVDAFTEKAAEQSDLRIDKGHELMEFFLMSRS